MRAYIERAIWDNIVGQGTHHQTSEHATQDFYDLKRHSTWRVQQSNWNPSTPNTTLVLGPVCLALQDVAY